MTTSPASGALPADTRAQFEHWWSDEGRYPEAVKLSYGNFYASKATQEAWFAWRACASALASREASPAALTDEQQDLLKRMRTMSENMLPLDGDIISGQDLEDLLDIAALASPQVAPACEPDAWHYENLSQYDNDPAPVWRTLVDKFEPFPSPNVRNIRPLCFAAPAPVAPIKQESYPADKLRYGTTEYLNGFNDAKAQFNRAPVAPTPAATKTMTCEDCGGCGEVGDAVYQGAFQPPERDRCESCQGSGLWEVSLTPAERAARAIEKARDDYAATHGKESGDAREHFDMLTEMAAKARASNLPTWDQGGCTVPPVGWWCSRAKGHDGPCAARRVGEVAPTPAQPSDDARDAARYRWLRHGDNDELVLQRYMYPEVCKNGITMFLLRNNTLDAAIDAAMPATLPSEPEGESAPPALKEQQS